jgi:hypothetical protein
MCDKKRSFLEHIYHLYTLLYLASTCGIRYFSVSKTSVYETLHICQQVLLEVVLVESPEHLKREWNEEVGLALIRL